MREKLVGNEKPALGLMNCIGFYTQGHGGVGNVPSERSRLGLEFQHPSASPDSRFCVSKAAAKIQTTMQTMQVLVTWRCSWDNDYGRSVVSFSSTGRQEVEGRHLPCSKPIPHSS